MLSLFACSQGQAPIPSSFSSRFAHRGPQPQQPRPAPLLHRCQGGFQNFCPGAISMGVPAKLEVPSPRRRLWIRRTALVLLHVSNTAQPWPTAGPLPLCASGSASWRPRTSIENFYPRASTRRRSLFLPPSPAISTHSFASARLLAHERCKNSQQSRPPLAAASGSDRSAGTRRGARCFL